MNGKNTGIEKRVLTLLELSKNSENRRPPSPTFSSSSDDDQPPIASSKIRPRAKSAITLGRNYNIELSSLPSKRRGRNHSENLLEPLPVKREISFKTLYGANYLNPPSRNSASQSMQSAGEAKASSSKISEKRINMSETTPPARLRNYYIKSIRKGIPEIISTDPRGKNKVLVSTDVEISPYCVCIKNSNRRTDVRAWSFSFATAFLCVICPLISFSTDVAFFSVCGGQYNKSLQLLQDVKEKHGDLVIPTSTKKPSPHLQPAPKSVIAEHRRHSNRFERELHQKAIFEKFFTSKKAIKRNAKRSLALPFKNNTNIRSEFKLVATASTKRIGATKSDNLPITKYYVRETIDRATGKCQFSSRRASACSNKTAVIAYLLSSKARTWLDSHHHVIKDVFEPIFILGSFPSLLLCMFTRSVIILTSHDHFLSAYFMNIMIMPLQLATGAVSYHSASYHFGSLGLGCWKYALNENTPVTEAGFREQDDIIVSLATATAAKFLDGMAGGIVLVVVLFRSVWTSRGHVSCWWYFARSILSLLIILFCLTVSSTMLITPSLAVFQYELLDKLIYFKEKSSLCYTSLAILSVGASAWGVSLLVLLLYLCYRTYVYCRIKEHLSDNVPL